MTNQQIHPDICNSQAVTVSDLSLLLGEKSEAKHQFLSVEMYSLTLCMTRKPPK